MPEPDQKKNSNDSAIRAALWPLVSIATFLAIVTATLNAADQFLTGNSTIAAAALYIGLASLIWNIRLLTFVPYRMAVAAYRLHAVLILTATFFVLIFGEPVWQRVLQPWINPQPAEAPQLQLPSLFVSRAWGQAANSGLSLEEFYADETQSTYTEAEEDGLRSFSYNLRVAEAFKRADCIGPRGKGYIRAVLPVLLHHLQEKNLMDHAFALESYDAYKDTVTASRGVFDEIFRDIDLNELKQAKPDDFQRLREYLVYCAGVREPIFVFVLSNRGNSEIIVSELEYDVSKVGQVKGGDAKLLEPLATENHAIPHRPGRYVRRLTKPLLLSPSSSARIDIRLFSENPGKGLVWEMAIAIRSTDGQSVTTPPFRLTMSK